MEEGTLCVPRLRSFLRFSSNPQTFCSMIWAGKYNHHQTDARLTPSYPNHCHSTANHTNPTTCVSSVNGASPHADPSATALVAVNATLVSTRTTVSSRPGHEAHGLSPAPCALDSCVYVPTAGPVSAALELAREPVTPSEYSVRRLAVSPASSAAVPWYVVLEREKRSVEGWRSVRRATQDLERSAGMVLGPM